MRGPDTAPRHECRCGTPQPTPRLGCEFAGVAQESESGIAGEQTDQPREHHKVKVVMGVGGAIEDAVEFIPELWKQTLPIF